MTKKLNINEFILKHGHKNASFGKMRAAIESDVFGPAQQLDFSFCRSEDDKYVNFLFEKLKELGFIEKDKLPNSIVDSEIKDVYFDENKKEIPPPVYEAPEHDEDDEEYCSCLDCRSKKDEIDWPFISVVYVTDNSYLGINCNNVYVHVHMAAVDTLIPKLIEFNNWAKDNLQMNHYAPRPQRKIPRGSVHLLIETPDGLDIMRAPTQIKYDLIEDNYSTEVIKSHNIVKQKVVLPNPPGKIVIYQGAPGTGKTYLIRNLISSLLDVKILLCQASQVEKMTNPNFLTTLIENLGHEFIFIVEDADEILAPRTGSNMGSISALLNLGDGILGNIFDTRIICTTNTKVKEFDEAITRPGRLLKLVNVDALSEAEANSCGRKIIGDKWVDLEGEKTLAQIYQAANDIRNAEEENS